LSKVAVIGSGFVGRAWAISFARGGHEVALWDQDPQAPERALAYVEKLLPDLEDNDLLNGATAKAIALRMRPAATLEAALDGSVHVQENTPEEVEVKREVFARLDAAAAPDAVLASSTSAILPSAFTEALSGRARCLVVHPINPPYLIPAPDPDRSRCQAGHCFRQRPAIHHANGLLGSAQDAHRRRFASKSKANHHGSLCLRRSTNARRTLEAAVIQGTMSAPKQ
jgi:predicted dinucleotide-binding enzyme